MVLKLKEFFESQVPQNEFKVLSNGRLTCLICSFRPIFDTHNMLLLHRKGKKHISEWELYLKRKEELKFEKLKQRQICESRKRSALIFNREASNMIAKTKCRRRPVLELPLFLNNTKLSKLSVSVENISKKGSDGVISKKGLVETEGCHTIIKQSSSKEKGKLQKTSVKSIIDRSELPLPENMQLIMSGWVKDASGKWVKDPNAEFDSDEGESPSCSLNPD